MTLPKFTAESALGKATRTYRGSPQFGRFSQSGQPAIVVQPSQLDGAEGLEDADEAGLMGAEGEEEGGDDEGLEAMGTDEGADEGDEDDSAGEDDGEDALEE